jgi:hypothetical protein
LATEAETNIAAIAERDLDPRVAFILSRELRRLALELRESERLLCLAMTKSPFLATGVFALTDQRVLYVRRPLLGRRFRIKTIGLEDVMTVETRMDLGVLTIFITIYRDGRMRLSQPLSLGRVEEHMRADDRHACYGFEWDLARPAVAVTGRRSSLGARHPSRDIAARWRRGAGPTSSRAASG